jgi:hypothetical protein
MRRSSGSTRIKGVQLRERLVLGHPAAEDAVGDGELACLVVHLDDDVLAKVLQRDLGAQARLDVPDAVGPTLELQVVGHPALQHNALELGAPRRFAARGAVAADPMLDDLGGAFQRADLADTGDEAPVSAHAKLEVLVRIEALRVDVELRHGRSPSDQAWL